MAFDQGTSSCRVVLFDRDFKIAASQQMEFKQIYPNHGWVEHDAEEIFNIQIDLSKNCLSENNISASEIAALGISNQRETTVLWNRNTGKPICNAIVWQDTRTTDICKEWIEKGYNELVRSKTGLVIDSYFSASKIKWMLDHVENAREMAENDELLFGTIDSWLIWKLTNGEKHSTDYSNASRTMLFNISELKWDEELLNLFDIPKNIMPLVNPTVSHFGNVAVDFFNEVKIPIYGVAGDQQAALFGNGCYEKGTLKNTYGTGCFMLLNTGEKLVFSSNGLLSTIAWSINNQVYYALEGSVFIAGAAIQWLRDEMCMLNTASESDKMASGINDNNGVYFVPAFSGMGTPYWDMDARGMLIGISRDTSKAHIVRAALESIAYQTRDVTELMKSESGIEILTMNVDGGASNNDFLMQFQADISDVDVLRPLDTEATVFGAACFAALGSGFWTMEQLINRQSVHKVFKPEMPEEQRKALYGKWKQAVERCLKWDC